MDEAPNLIIAGFLKCGTTSLARYLADHPEVAVPEVKELYLYVDKGSSLETYGTKIRRQTRAPVSGKAKYLLDATPFYYSQNSALVAAAGDKRMKIIFITREPESRLRSSFRFFSEMYQEYPASEFAEFVEALLEQSAHERYRRLIKSEFFRELFSLELQMGRYADHIERWQEAVSDDRLLVLSVESMKGSPSELMSRVCDFLEISNAPYADYPFTAYMKSYNVRNRPLQRLLRLFGGEDLMRYDGLSEYQNPLHFAGTGKASLLASRLLRGVQQTSRSYALSPESQFNLREYYRSSNEWLAARYGIKY